MHAGPLALAWRAALAEEGVAMRPAFTRVRVHGAPSRLSWPRCGTGSKRVSGRWRRDATGAARRCIVPAWSRACTTSRRRSATAPRATGPSGCAAPRPADARGVAHVAVAVRAGRVLRAARGAQERRRPGGVGAPARGTRASARGDGERDGRVGRGSDGVGRAGRRGAASQIRRGRRVAVHEHPFRADAWVEDQG